LWTAGVVALAAWIGPMMYVELVPIERGEHSIQFSVSDEQDGLIELSAIGTGLGRRPGVDQIWAELHGRRAFPMKSPTRRLMWSSDMAPGTCKMTVEDLKEWLKEWGLPTTRINGVAAELLKVIATASRLTRLDLFGYTGLAGPGTASRGIAFAGVALHEFGPGVYGHDSTMSHHLFSTLPWILAAGVILWIVGLRILVPRRTVIIPLFMCRGIEATMAEMRGSTHDEIV
jgi:hypothetical protein